MKPAVGKSHADVQFETQWLLAETEAGECVMLVPLIDGAFRFSLSGGDAGLVLTGETGDPFTFGTGGVALFVSVGRDPYAMADAGAKAVMKRLGTGRLRLRKARCPISPTSSAGARGIHSTRKFRPTRSAHGLESFKAGGVEPRLLILDDGWQDYKRMPSGEERLVSLEANQERFGGDLDADRETRQAGLQNPRVSRVADDVRLLGRRGRQIAARATTCATCPGYSGRESCTKSRN